MTTLLPALCASCLFFCVQSLKTVVVDIPIGSINLGFITEGNTYLHCAAITRSSSWKTQRRSQVLGKISGAVVGEYHHQLSTSHKLSFTCSSFYFLLYFSYFKKIKNTKKLPLLVTSLHLRSLVFLSCLLLCLLGHHVSRYYEIV